MAVYGGDSSAMSQLTPGMAISLVSWTYRLCDLRSTQTGLDALPAGVNITVSAKPSG